MCVKKSKMGKFLCKSHKDAAKVVKIIEIYKNYNKKVYFSLKNIRYYICVILDLYARKVVAYSISNNNLIKAFHVKLYNRIICISVQFRKSLVKHFLATVRAVFDN